MLFALALKAIALVSLTVTNPTPLQKVAVFIHGAGGGGWEWNAWKPVFEKAGWTCVAEDLVPTSAGIAETRFSDYEYQVEHWATTHGPSHLVLIGASMGGILALKAGGKLHPEAIVLVNSVGPAGVVHRAPKSYPSVIEWSKGTLKETQDSMPDSDEATIQFAFKHWRDESGAVLTEISKGITVQKPSGHLLVILGDKDTDVPNAIGREMAKKFGGQLKVFKGMSHVSPLLGTRAPEVAKYTVDWLNKKIR